MKDKEPKLESAEKEFELVIEEMNQKKEELLHYLKREKEKEKVDYQEVQIQFSIDQISRNIKNQLRFYNTSEIEKLKLIDVALEKIVTPDEFEDILVFTHHFSLTFMGERTQYINVLTFHSDDLKNQTNNVFMPFDFEVTFDDNKVEIKNKYELDEDENKLIEFLNSINYYYQFEKNHTSNIIKALEKMGYDIQEL